MSKPKDQSLLKMFVGHRLNEYVHMFIAIDSEVSSFICANLCFISGEIP